MEPCRLLEENDRAHFMTRRFDRDGNRKHHVQSLCAIQHLDYNQRGTHAYEQLFLIARQLGLGDHAHTEILRRMAFNVMARHHVHHTKTHALLLRAVHRLELAPHYDVPPTYNPNGQGTYPHRTSEKLRVGTNQTIQ